MPAVTVVLADLIAEGEELEALVAPLPAAVWATETLAEGWTISHQIAHLTMTDLASLIAITDTAMFGRVMDEIAQDPLHSADRAANELSVLPPDELLARWRDGRANLVAALAAVPDGTKIPWLGPPMNARSMASARLMETWAHGLDVADALGVRRKPTARLKNVAHLGVRTRNFAFIVHEISTPTEEFRVELTAPDGEIWAWGPPGAVQRVTGPAEDFCRLVTQRAHPDDLAVRAVGDDARHWLTIAQVFAGPPGSGRKSVKRNVSSPVFRINGDGERDWESSVEIPI
ncbi:TIGR03084 family metal-binding protein [Rhodococcus opacus]|uniref:TIGR03084 family metal-binding protein n=1 Tax=Rhodococcus opacus TaxID=37919 RepID=UPI001C465590|nr:TIGR03084 family metal-binding protein [Rhodococcus opacus]MBV6760408.1 TIGR03084 family protein [Rhodococcus opacus]